MRFEISERIITNKPQEAIFAALQEQFKKVSNKVTVDAGKFKAVSIEASFGSINRKDETIVSIKPLDDGYLLTADVRYRPSVSFWVIFLITLFSWVGWIVPLAFYLTQKKVVKQAVKSCFERIKNEFEQPSQTRRGFEDPTVAVIEKLAALKARGLLTEEEFELRKKSLFSTGQDRFATAEADIRSEPGAATEDAAQAATGTDGFTSAASAVKTMSANFDHDIPPGVKGWSWGAFFLHFIWAVPNKTWIGLLAIVPVIGLPVPFILGFKGREWAWRNRHWDSVAQFNEVQRKWAVWGFVFYAVALTIVLGSMGYPRLADYIEARSAHKQALAEAQLEGPAVTKPVGTVSSGVTEDPSDRELDPAQVSRLIFEKSEETFYAQTKAGLMTVVWNAANENRVLLNGKALFHGDDAQWQKPVKLFQLASGQEAILVESSGGRGTSCETLLFFIVIDSQANVKWTPEFGTCARDGTYTRDSNRVVLTIPKMGGHTVYAFDGNVLTEDGKPVNFANSGDDPAK